MRLNQDRDSQSEFSSTIDTLLLLPADQGKKGCKPIPRVQDLKDRLLDRCGLIQSERDRKAAKLEEVQVPSDHSQIAYTQDIVNLHCMSLQPPNMYLLYA